MVVFGSLALAVPQLLPVAPEQSSPVLVKTNYLQRRKFLANYALVYRETVLGDSAYRLCVADCAIAV